MGKLYRIKRKLQKKWEAYKKEIAKPNKDALWVFGMQKAGTTAIAGLLAHRANKTVTLDTPCLWNPYFSKIINRDILINKHIQEHPFDFSKDIIKEPNATFIINQISESFKLKKYVYIVRNPFDNIRSILNRLDLPGDKQNVSYQDIHENWRGLFKNKGNNYIKDLAELWIITYSNDKFINNENCILIKYEDFKTDKSKFIDRLCDKTGFQKVNSIEHLMDHNFQPKGNSSVDLKSFFGEENYSLILKICHEQMIKFDYT